MRRRLGNAQTGFTLIELLIVIAIIGLLAAMLIPNLLDAMHKAKQKRTVADIRITGTAMMSWLSDEVGAAAAGQTATSIDIGEYKSISRADLGGLLVPAYIELVPQLDGWKTPYEYFLDTTTPLSKHVMAMGSGGLDKSAVGGTYPIGGFDPTDYEQDIIWVDGYFVRWPQK